MHWIDWTIVGAYLVWVIWDGIRLSRGTHEVEGYFLANRSLPWWAVGLSVMATQMSAITLVGTTGQGYTEGLRFVQFYFGLPIAMVILSVTVVPFFHRARVYTAYEYLERRFGVVTRSLTSFLFLISRGLSCGIIIAAPALILSIVLEWDLTLTILGIGIPTVAYTMKGGVQAVTWVDVKQMVIIVGGLFAAVAVAALGLPDDLGVGPALRLAGSVGKLDAVDFRFDPTEQFTFWSGLLGGLFLALGYFGCDQSQVQRYLTAKSVDEGRRSLLMSAYWKIPLQALILFTGVLVFLYFLFQPAPMLFNPVYAAAVARSDRAAEYGALEADYAQAIDTRRAAARVMAAGSDGVTSTDARQAFVASDESVREIRARATALVREVAGDANYRDVNYVFPTFVTEHMPVGLVGLLIAAIFAAAMSSIAAELNSLSTATVIDFYKRLFRQEAPDAHYLLVSKIATGFWGAFACVAAVYAANLDSLIVIVNRIGSLFYGSILGVFILALGFKRANGIGASVGLLAGMTAVGLVAAYTPIAFLWHNVIGAVVVTVVGVIVSAMTGGPAEERPRVR